MKDININIQAHHKRESFIPYLKERLGKNTKVIWDQKNCVWDTRKRCIEDHIKSGKKWGLTIQDDCLLTTDFLKKMEKFILKHERRSRPTVFNFYFWNLSTQQVLRAKKVGHFRSAGMKSGLAICMPTRMMPDLLRFWENRNDLIRHDDGRIGRFLRTRGIRTIYPCPSLVQHRDGPSLIYKKGEMPEHRMSITYVE